MSFLNGLDNPLDQYFMRHPEAFFQKSVENALVNPENHYILRAHLVCAAWEMPLGMSDEKYFGPQFAQEIAGLAEEGPLRKGRRIPKWYLSPNISFPAQAINIRSTSMENYALIDTSTGALLETIDGAMAFFQIYPGAIYLHLGETYLVTRLDLTGHTAYAAPTSATYYTHTKEIQDLRIIKEWRRKNYGQITVCLGEVMGSTNVG